MSSTRTIDPLEIFKTRREYCRSLLQMSQEQLGLVENNDYTQLLELLGRKQRLLGRLHELSGTHADVWTHWSELRGTIAPELRKECECVLEESEQLLAEVLDHEKAGTTILTEHRDATQRQLETVSQGVEVHEAYRDNVVQTTHRRLDVNR